AGTAARSDPARSGGRLVIDSDHHDVAAKADQVVELQFLAQHSVELLVAKTAVGDNAYLDVRRQRLGQTDYHLILILVAMVLERGGVHGEPHQRGSAAVPGQQ